MSDPQVVISMANPPPAGRGAMRRPHRSTSQSPARHRFSDSLLSRLSPMSAVEALRSPEGALKTCLDNAPASEQSFTMKTAVASRKICDWVDELSAWPWPTDSTSAGFEMPPSKRRKVSEPLDSSNDQHLQESADHSETEYLGSLPAQDVATYENRTKLIQRDLAALDVEEIKRHVLHNHILPLSRPSTPFSDSGHSVSSLISFTMMGDLTAVVTAITVQALPNLARLTSLLNIWSTRLVVLRKVPIVLSLITEAEVALEAGWNAIDVGGSTSPLEYSPTSTSAARNRLPLPRNDYEVMNQVLQKKVAQPAHDMDFMLDALEGSEDTLPTEWIDRLEAVEKAYAEWAITAERRVQEGEWYSSKAAAEQTELQIPETPQPKIQIQSPSSPIIDRNGVSGGVKDSTPCTPFDHSLLAGETNSPRTPSRRIASTDGQQEFCEDEGASLDYDETDDSYGISTKSLPIILKMDADAAEDPGTQPLRQLAPAAHIARMATPELETEHSYLESVVEEDEEVGGARLPPAKFVPRKISQESMASMEPEFARLPDPDEPLSDALSPPSSPPVRYTTHSNSVGFRDGADLSPEGLSPPKSPLESGVFDLDSSFDISQIGASGYATPGRSFSVSGPESELHRQIRGVLKSLPNNIRFTRREATIELNPPDLNMPGRPKLKLSDPVRRSGSALSTMSISSRAGTPSFLLAPAKESRHRTRNSRDAQTYFLSRSTGEAPMKLLIRSVGENGERVMVRVGGGWADLGEYLKEYAIHHGRRSQGEGKVEIKDVPRTASRAGSSPPSRPGTGNGLPMTPLAVRKTRRSLAGEDGPSKSLLQARPKTPLSSIMKDSETPDSGASGASGRSRSSTYSAGGDGDNSVLGLSGSRPKKMDMLSDESRAWVEEVTSKVRTASGEQRMLALDHQDKKGKFGELNKVGGTKRLFRKV